MIWPSVELPAESKFSRTVPGKKNGSSATPTMRDWT